MKYTKNKNLIFILILFSLFMVSCSNDSEPSIDPEEISQTTGFVAEEEGVYFVGMIGDTEDTLMKYYDLEKKKTMPLCNKANCKHQDNECPAVSLGNYKGRKMLMVMKYQNELYLYYHNFDEGSEDVLMKADLDGRNRELFFTMPPNMALNATFIYQNKFLMSCNSFSEYDETEGGIITITSLHELDLKTKKFKEIASTEKDENGFIHFIGCKEGKAYYLHNNYDKPNKPIYTYDLKSGKTTLLNDENTIISSFLYKDTLLYADESTNEIKTYNIFTKETSVIDTFTPHEGAFSQQSRKGILNLSYVVNPSTPEYILYTQAYDLDKKQFLFEQYKNNGEVKSPYQDGYLGSKDNEYGIFNKKMEFTTFE